MNFTQGLHKGKICIGRNAVSCRASLPLSLGIFSYPWLSNVHTAKIILDYNLDPEQRKCIAKYLKISWLDGLPPSGSICHQNGHWLTEWFPPSLQLEIRGLWKSGERESYVGTISKILFNQIGICPNWSSTFAQLCRNAIVFYSFFWGGGSLWKFFLDQMSKTKGTKPHI